MEKYNLSIIVSEKKEMVHDREALIEDHPLPSSDPLVDSAI